MGEEILQTLFNWLGHIFAVHHVFISLLCVQYIGSINYDSTSNLPIVREAFEVMTIEWLHEDQHLNAYN